MEFCIDRELGDNFLNEGALMQITSAVLVPFENYAYVYFQLTEHLGQKFFREFLFDLLS